jgi:hypothetical protein
LSHATNIQLILARTIIVPEGEIIGWKKCRDNVIVKLLIPSDSKRSNATGRKCRCEFAQVLEVFGAEIGNSLFNNAFLYKKGEKVVCDKWGKNRLIECGGGIHFYLTQEEAEAHS